ncbi:MAG: hypothetical protein UV42_C0036G0023 [Candidatus Magasanikbacteria bacterium GW2011_GWE2_42_7]|uniref:Uncharacterized protein n=1 Tax=Candidatus Magasanikbacteria bacterium GW2011_GWE2_42_7 TaxID=1619052 RepID=A0A0G1BCW4_9BACT|nr:MAG: hypothetical protein UV42_C0036G0023 [Candidatus Magasanikbacteria bacterium GW2011_GWE2_42_7]
MNPHHQTVRWLRGIMSQLKAALIAALITGFVMVRKAPTEEARDIIGAACASFVLTLFLALIIAWRALKVFDGKKSPLG